MLAHEDKTERGVSFSGTRLYLQINLNEDVSIYNYLTKFLTHEDKTARSVCLSGTRPYLQINLNEDLSIYNYFTIFLGWHMKIKPSVV